jgi:hypothetical protein
MATFKLQVSVKEDKDCIVVYDCTGKDETGWGIPNITLANVTSAQFEIYKPNTTSPLIIPVFPDFPTDDTTLGYELLTAKLQCAVIESGVWKIGYRIAGEDNNGRPFEKYAETKEVFIKSAQCCVDKLNATTINTPSTQMFKDEKKKAAAELNALMQQACWAKSCGKFEAAKDILKYINLQCECCN